MDIFLSKYNQISMKKWSMYSNRLEFSSLSLDFVVYHSFEQHVADVILIL